MRRLRDISDLAAVFGIALLPIATPVAALELEEVYGTLSFDRPVDLQHAGDGSGRLFVVEQAGLIKTIPADEADATASEPSVFLDIRDRVRCIGNEEGLLGLAFHPDFANNGFFFVNYTASSPRRTVIARFRAEGRQAGQGRRGQRAARPGVPPAILEPQRRSARFRTRWLSLRSQWRWGIRWGSSGPRPEHDDIAGKDPPHRRRRRVGGAGLCHTGRQSLRRCRRGRGAGGRPRGSLRLGPAQSVAHQL